jgi:hypothetical protein
MPPTTPARSLAVTDTTPVRSSMWLGAHEAVPPRPGHRQPMCVLAVFMPERALGAAPRIAAVPATCRSSRMTPAFSLTRANRAVRSPTPTWRGKVWVAQLLLRRVHRSVPHASAQRMQRDPGLAPAAPATDVRLVSITLDPLRRHGRSVLKQVRRSLPGRCRPCGVFLTTNRRQGRHARTRGERAFWTTGAEGQRPARTIEHGTSIAVVDRQGRVRAYHDGLAAATPDGKVVDRLSRPCFDRADRSMIQLQRPAHRQRHA